MVQMTLWKTHRLYLKKTTVQRHPERIGAVASPAHLSYWTPASSTSTSGMNPGCRLSEVGGFPECHGVSQTRWMVHGTTYLEMDDKMGPPHDLGNPHLENCEDVME